MKVEEERVRRCDLNNGRHDTVKRHNTRGLLGQWQRWRQLR